MKAQEWRRARDDSRQIAPRSVALALQDLRAESMNQRVREEGAVSGDDWRHVALSQRH
jgi:hypothetical protein